MQIPLTVGSFFILVRAVFCISANLTVNESIVGKKYPYLQTADRQFWNFFDRGVLANCMQFWLVSNPRPDWALIYQREQQVHSFADPHIILLNVVGIVPHGTHMWPVFEAIRRGKSYTCSGHVQGQDWGMHKDGICNPGKGIACAGPLLHALHPVDWEGSHTRACSALAADEGPGDCLRLISAFGAVRMPVASSM